MLFKNLSINYLIKIIYYKNIFIIYNMNNNLPSNVKKFINYDNYDPKDYSSFNNNDWTVLGLQILKSNKGEVYKLVNINEKYQKIIPIKKIDKNNYDLCKNNIYIGILNYRIIKGNKITNINNKIVYYGTYLKKINSKSGDTLIKFKNNKPFSYKYGDLYKLYINIDNKYGINNNSWNENNNLIKKYDNDFLFKKKIKIPKDLVSIVEKSSVSISYNNNNNNNNNNITRKKIINAYKKNISNNTTLVSCNCNSNLDYYNSNYHKYYNHYELDFIYKSKISIKSNIIKLKDCSINNINNINNEKSYFAYIVYKYCEDQIFDKIIYLSKFIKKEDDFLFFENVIINPKSKKLKKFDLYYTITENLNNTKFF